MHDDVQAIRDVIANWKEASEAGDLSRILSLMTDDVVFLTAGNPPMRGRDGFAAAFEAMHGRVDLDVQSEILDIQVNGNWAYCWTQMRVVVKPLPAGEPAQRSGNTLSIFRKNPDGVWQLWRDANLMVKE